LYPVIVVAVPPVAETVNEPVKFCIGKLVATADVPSDVVTLTVK
jgi:hypothetical protein